MRARLISAIGFLSAALWAEQGEPTFQIFKYQHAVGKEIDVCNRDGATTYCRAHFQLDFTGSSIALDAQIQTGAQFQPVFYSAKGRNSTRSFVDLEVTIDGQQAKVAENGITRDVPLPAVFFHSPTGRPFHHPGTTFRLLASARQTLAHRADPRGRGAHPPAGRCETRRPWRWNLDAVFDPRRHLER